MGSASSVTATSAAPKDASSATDETSKSVAPKDCFIWIVSSLKETLPYLDVESVLCLHNVHKRLIWHVHNLHTWRLLLLRDFPNARSKFHDRLILREPDTTASTTTEIPDEHAKALYFELFCQRFVMEAEVCLHSHCTGPLSRQLHELHRHGDNPIPVTFKANIGRVPPTFPAFPSLKPSETSSLTLEWIPR